MTAQLDLFQGEEEYDLVRKYGMLKEKSENANRRAFMMIDVLNNKLMRLEGRLAQLEPTKENKVLDLFEVNA